jgi:quinol monooxygenase YgiN
MKRFLITYTFREGAVSVDAWHKRVAEFISAVESDAELEGSISYRCMKARDRPVYYHIAEARTDEAIQALVHRDYFKRYTEETKRVGGGEVLVSPLDTIAETRPA